MSGRLVILPHKSWNVWNQDNREKVARDERLHREAEEAKAAKDKQLLQEQNLELLRDGEVAIKIEPGSIDSSGQVEPFRLFEDLEKQHYARLGNEDFLKEKAQKELLQKKRDGIADWALGEGSVENSKVRPWYEKLGMGEAVPPASGPRSGREIHRKEKADPMGSILKPNSYEYQPKPVMEQNKIIATDLSFLESAGAKLDSIESKANESSDSEQQSRRKEKKRSHKEDRKSKKHSKRKHNDSSEDERSRKKDKKSKHHSADSPDVKIKTEKPAEDPWAELRKKRLEREAIERKRAAVLLATVDVYGPGAVGSGIGAGQGYGQQYHPHLARHKR